MIDIIGQALRTKLAATTAVTSLVSTRIFNTHVPAGTAYPYVVMFLGGGGDTNDTPTQNIDMTMTVKIVATSGSVAASGAAAIRSALYEADLGTVGGWNFYRCQVGALIFFDEQIEMTQIYHAGYIVRIRAHKEG